MSSFKLTHSTAHAASPGTAPLRQVRDLRRLWRIFAAVVIPLGPLLTAVGRGILPYWTTDPTATMVANSLAAQPTMTALHWMGLIYIPVMLLGTLGLGYVARRGAPLLATIGTALAFWAWALSAATVNTDALVWSLGLNGYSAGSITDILTALAGDPVGMVGAAVWLVGHVVGMVLLGVALGRAGILNWWFAAGLIVCQPIHLVSAVILPSRLLDVTLGWGLAAACCVAVAVAVLRMDDAEWDLAPKSPPARS